jgi:hypothetical protein
MMIELGSDASRLTARRRMVVVLECDWGSKGKDEATTRARRRYIEGT